jgi:hypothetical protein
MEKTNMVTLRSLAPSLTRITVAGAVGAALHIGQGNCDLVDDQAVEFSRAVLHQTDIEGEVICCEGPKTMPQASNTEKKSAQAQVVVQKSSSSTPLTEQLLLVKAEKIPYLLLRVLLLDVSKFCLMMVTTSKLLP